MPSSTTSAMPNQQSWQVSVVIPTLGGDSLRKTIEHLNRGTLIPAEVLVCIPEQEAPRAEALAADNVKIITTKCRGQVAQRAVGFQHAQYDLVLQLDDDIFLRDNCLKDLVACSLEFGNVAVGPKLYDASTGHYHSFLTPNPRAVLWFERLLFRVVNGPRGYEPGEIGKSGICMGLPEEPGTWTDIGWLPGGCVLHKKQNLVLFDFYPFRGKAFAEDLFHSVLLKEKGVRLIRCGGASCDVNFSHSDSFRPISFLKWYFAYARALRTFAKSIGGSLFHLYLYILLNIAGHVASRLVADRSKV